MRKTGRMKMMTALGFAFAALCLAAPLRANAFDVEFDVQPRVLQMGETAQLIIRITGHDNPAQPQLPDIPGFQVGGVSTERSFSFGTGQGSQSAITFRYTLLPTRTGKLTVGPFQFDQNGRNVNLPAVDVEVVAPGGQADGQSQQSEMLFAVMTADTTNIYNQQVFSLTLSIYTRINIGSQIELHNMPPSGLQVFYPFQELQGSREVMNNRVYEVRRYRCKAQALTSGKFVLQPVLRVPVQVNRERRRDPFGFDHDPFGFFGPPMQPVDVTVQPLELAVQRLPAEQPPGFAGAIGKFTFEARVQPREVNEGDPVTLSIQILGEGNIENVSPPEIAESDDFRIYEPKMVAKEINQGVGRKSFEQVLIPRKSGKIDLPALTFSYFDPNRGAYETASRGPFTLTVKESSGAETRVARAADKGSEETETVLLGSDIVYLKRPPSKWRIAGERHWYASGTFVAVQLVPALALVSVALLARRRNKLAGDVALARRQRAPRAARLAVKKAEEAADRGDRLAFYEALWEAQASYFGDRLNLAPGAVSANAVVDALTRGGLDLDSVRQIEELFARCEQERFGGSGSSESKQQWMDLLNRLNRLLKTCEKIRI